jgi:hypothetical protein
MLTALGETALVKTTLNSENHVKAKFVQVFTFFHKHIFLPWEFLLVKKLEIEKTKTNFVISVLKVVY